MDNWGTPEWLMNVFEDWFDPCPFNPEFDKAKHQDGLEIEWKDKTYVNPPYSNPLKWVEKAIEENKKGKTIAMLLKVDTSTRWFAKLNEAGAYFLWLNGRLKFKGKNWHDGEGKLSPANFPSMLAILSRTTEVRNR
jgi:hypothetical protein